MALTDILYNSLNVYNDTDNAWYQFVLDHKTYLLNNSETRYITTAYLQKYFFNLQGYLTSINYPVSCAWIVGLINNIPSDIQFDINVNKLNVPKFSVIQNLYTTYITTRGY